MEQFPHTGVESQENKKFAWQKNLEMMNTEMQTLLYSESVGGNGGKLEVDGKKYSGAVANGYANPETGEIIAFGNSQNIPQEVKTKNQEFTMRVAFDVNRGFFNVVDIVGIDGFSDSAMGTLHESMVRYNLYHEQEDS